MRFGLNFNISYTSDISECMKLIENYKERKEEYLNKQRIFKQQHIGKSE